jgi:phenylpropionate dioxygenase-like ring-hydroxylating dioxygenase large terminal subunit
MTVTYDTPDAKDGQPAYQLPPSAYFDPAWFEREKREIFGRTWNYVGHQLDLPEPGSFLTAVVGTEPVVVVRRADGSLTGYVNVCRHRGMTIVQGEGESCTGTCGESLRCPYHGWEWELDGTLVRVPQRKTQFPDLDTDTLGLFPVAVASWAGLIFVHPDPTQAESFDEWLGDFPLRSGDFPWDDLVQVRRVRTPLKCNWKLYIENHIDWLHLWYLHEDSLGMYDHPNGRIWEIGDHFASAEQLRKDKERPQADGLIEIPDMAPEEADLLRANLLFPNVPFVTVPTGFSTYQVVPTGPETCELDFRLFGLPGSDITDEALAYNMMILVDEDGGACEQMQASIHSPHFQVGPLATDFERPIAHFHEGVIRFMGTP